MENQKLSLNTFKYEIMLNINQWSCAPHLRQLDFRVKGEVQNGAKHDGQRQFQAETIIKITTINIPGYKTISIGNGRFTNRTLLKIMVKRKIKPIDA